MDLGPEARAVIARLKAIDWDNAAVDRPRAEAALMTHLARLDLPERPVRWVADPEAALAHPQSAVTPESERYRLALPTHVIAGGSDYGRGSGWRRELHELMMVNSGYLTTLHRARFRAWATEAALHATMPQVAHYVAMLVQRHHRRAKASDPSRTPKVDHWLHVHEPFVAAAEAGLCAFWVGSPDIIAVPPPVIRSAAEELHNAAGPALFWPGGATCWYWQGVRVPRNVIEAPETLSLAQIEAEHNSETRRIMIERFGVARYVRAAGADIIDQDPRWGTLMRKSHYHQEDILILEVVNGTPEPDGSLGWRQKLTALNAVASTYGMTGEAYQALTLRT